MRKILSFLVAFGLIVLASGCRGGGGSGGSSAGSNSDLQFAMDDSTGYLLEEQFSPGSDSLGTETLAGLDVNSQDNYTGEGVSSGAHLNPEPSTIVMFGLSIIGLLGYGMRRIVKVRS